MMLKVEMDCGRSMAAFERDSGDSERVVSRLTFSPEAPSEVEGPG
jgi:hypothetical protein